MKKASSVVILSQDGRSILLQHRDDNCSFFSGLWGLIGGEALPDETAEECAQREGLEELGQQVENLQQQFLICEHCEETVFSASLGNQNGITCGEGQEISFIPIDRLADIMLSEYHRKIILRFLGSRCV